MMLYYTSITGGLETLASGFYLDQDLAVSHAYMQNSQAKKLGLKQGYVVQDIDDSNLTVEQRKQIKK